MTSTRTATLALIGALIGSALTGCTATSIPSPITRTVQVHQDSTTDRAWDALRAAGYVGVQGDGCECLYVPESEVIVDADGEVHIPFDANGDGWIDLSSDIELGA